MQEIDQRKEKKMKNEKKKEKKHSFQQ